MDADKAKEILDKVVGAVFGYQNPLSLEQAMQKFAFDLRLPQQVYDITTNEPTWALSVNPSRFMSTENARQYGETHNDWMLEKRELNSIEEIAQMEAMQTVEPVEPQPTIEQRVTEIEQVTTEVITALNDKGIAP